MFVFDCGGRCDFLSCLAPQYPNFLSICVDFQSPSFLFLFSFSIDTTYDSEASSITQFSLQPLSEPVQTTAASNQSMIDSLTGLLQGDADNITLSKAQALDLVQCLQRPTEGNANPKSDREQQVVEDLKQMHAYTRLGDYAGRVFNDLKDSTNNHALLGRADELVRNFDGVKPTTKTRWDARAALRSAVDNLDEFQHIDFDTAEFAVRAYSSRNEACHSVSMRLKTAENWSALGDQIQTDLTELAEILPARELGRSDKWRKLIEYFRDRYLVQDSLGFWQKRADVHPLDKAVEDQADKDKARTRTMHMLIDLFENGRFGDLPKTSTEAEKGRSKSLADLYGSNEYGDPPSNSDNSKRMALVPPEGESPAKKLRMADGLIGNSAINHSKMHQVREYVLQFLDLVIDYARQQPGKCNQILEAMICDMRAALGVSGRTQGGEGQADEEGNFGWLDEVADSDTVIGTEAVFDKDTKMSSQAPAEDSADISSQHKSKFWKSSSESETEDPDTTTAAPELAAGDEEMTDSFE